MEQVDILLENQGLCDINPLVCGSQHCDPGYRFGPAVRDYWLIHYVQAGCGELHSPRGDYHIGKGQLFIIRPGEVNTYAADSADPWRYSWVGFTAPDWVAEVLAEDVITAPECGHIFQELTACGDQAQGREWYVCGKTYELMALLRQRGALVEDRSARYVAMAVNFIHTNYMQEMRVERMAAGLGLERSYFSNLFKEATGKSPQQYMVDYRLEKAAAMIAAGHRPGEAAVQVGYTDPSLFYRMFKGRFGVAPSKYRALHNKQ